jgi:hypothetical protein
VERKAKHEERTSGQAPVRREGRSRQRSESGGDTERTSSEGTERSSERAHARDQFAPPDCRAECDAAIQVVSVAFLDASLRDRPAARHWLEEQVPQWLEHLGTWRKR